MAGGYKNLGQGVQLCLRLHELQRNPAETDWLQEALRLAEYDQERDPSPASDNPVPRLRLLRLFWSLNGIHSRIRLAEACLDAGLHAEARRTARIAHKRLDRGLADDSRRSPLPTTQEPDLARLEARLSAAPGAE